MAFSTRGKKIMLQIMSGFALVSGITTISAALFCLIKIADIDEYEYVTDLLLIDTISGYPVKIILWYHLINSTVITIFSIFGIYNVVQEKSVGMKVYLIYHVDMMLFNIYGAFLFPFVVVVMSMVFSGIAAYLSFQLIQSFKTKRSEIA